MPVSKSADPVNQPDLFQLCRVANHCEEGYSSLNGSSSKRSYSMRQDGDIVLALKEDVVAQPNKFIPLDKEGEPFVPDYFTDVIVGQLEWAGGDGDSDEDDPVAD